MTTPVTIQTTDFGFLFGAADVNRLTHGQDGSVVIEVKTSRGNIHVYVTKTGKLRVHSDAGEWLPEHPSKEPLCR